MRIARRLGVFALLVLGAACSDDPAPPAAATPADPAPAEKKPSVPSDPPPPPAKVHAKPTFPEVQSAGGPVITSPKVVPIVFAGDPLAAQITSFTKKMAGSAYWKGVATEYGVGAITALETVVVDEAPPANLTASEIETWLAAKLSGPAPAFGAADPDTLYAIFYPPNVSITIDGQSGELGQSCAGYGGYHYEIAAAGKAIGYAVLPRCSNIDELTVAASHEYFEWATDPFPVSKPAFSKLDAGHWAWQAAMIGELSDLCTFLDRENLKPDELGFVVQRQWSNKLSLAGGYPCAPVRDIPYVQAIAYAEDDAIVPDYAGTGYVQTKAIRVAPGTSRTVDVLLYSDRKYDKAVPLRTYALADFYGSTEKSGFTFRVAGSGKVGDTVELRVDAPKAAGYDVVVVMATVDAKTAHFWPVLVVNDAGDGSNVAAPSLTREMLPKKPQRGRIPVRRSPRLLDR